MNQLQSRLIFRAQFAKNFKSRLRGGCFCFFKSRSILDLCERNIMALQREGETSVIGHTLSFVDLENCTLPESQLSRLMSRQI